MKKNQVFGAFAVLFSTISAFNEKKIQESYRAKVYEFKNEITNIIQEDMVKRGLQFVKISETGSPGGDGKKYTVDLTFGDGTQKKLVIFQRFTRTSYRASGNVGEDDRFYIDYGLPTALVRYELPDLGSTSGYFYTTNSGGHMIDHFSVADDHGNCFDTSNNPVTCRVAKDFQINNVEVYVSNEADLDAEAHIFHLYIGFYHPNLETKYAINIVVPINYYAGVVDQSNRLYSSFSVPANSSTQVFNYDSCPY